MLFNSVAFLIFIALVMPVYFLLPQKGRPLFLLAASWYFYMSWNPAYLLLLIGFMLLIFLLAGRIEKTNRHAVKKAYLIFGLAVSFGALFLFKYFDTLSLIAADFFGFFGKQTVPFQLGWVLPVGISFFTFQLTGYLIDVYRGDMKHEKNFLYFALYISFFPQLVAGPIERAQNLLPQLKQKHRFHATTFRCCMIRILWGYIKKTVIADRLSIFVDSVFSAPDGFDGWVTLIAILFFAVQIYCDFSGYCDIAIGISRIMGIRLMTNFDRSYSAVSIKEFWDKWHISLSTWLRDYIYIPLGGNRVSKLRYFWNILVTFIASGVWHGAGMTYFLWGAVHGVAVAGHRLLCGKQKKPHSVPGRLLGRLATFLFVCLAWVLFRAQTLGDAWAVFQNLTHFTPLFRLIADAESQLYQCGLTGAELILSAISIVLLFSLEKRGDRILISSVRWAVPFRWLIVLLMMFVCIIFGIYGDNTVMRFIYFQF